MACCVCMLNSLYVCGLHWPVCIRDALACFCVCAYVRECVGTYLSDTEIFLLPSKFPGAVTLLTGLCDVLG